jgi:hypothetical protein
MKTVFLTLFTLCLVQVSATQAGAQGKKSNDATAVLGDWHGTSLCLVKPSACHDEEALYHVKQAPEKPGGLAMQADKIADGKPESMGDADCSYDATKKLLHCDLGRSSIELTLEGDRLEGAMFLRDKTRWREIKLTRVKS